jgi:glycosyltransferase involved in cell wall biosynthesis
MKFSVIIPTYNRSKQLMLTLAAFEKQNYPMDRFDILIVNDGSTDDTAQRLQSYQPPYSIQVMNLSAQTGRSAARNAGVAACKEEMIIFCDPDFLVTPDFLQVHARYAADHPSSIISGVPNLWKSCFTHVHPDFSFAEKALMAQVLFPHGLWNDRYFTTPDIVEIVTVDDIRNQTDTLSKVIATWDVYDSIKVQYAQTDVAPWLLCVTRCMSIPKKLFYRAGGFYEGFKKYGLEDWELGYRLHKKGVPFISISETIGYHQEHASAPRFEDEGSDNLRMAYQLHGFEDPEFSMFSFCVTAEQVQMYKNILRILRQWDASKEASYRNAASDIRRACTECAKQFFKQPRSQEHQHMSTLLSQAFFAADAVYMEGAEYKHQRIRAILDEVCTALRPLWPPIEQYRSISRSRRKGRQRSKRKGRGERIGKLERARGTNRNRRGKGKRIRKVDRARKKRRNRAVKRIKHSWISQRVWRVKRTKRKR